MSVNTMTSKKHEVPQELLTQLQVDYKKPEDLIGENGLLKQLTELLVENALDAELSEHLGHDCHTMAGKRCRQYPQRQEQEDAQG